MSAKRVEHSFMLQCLAYEHIMVVHTRELPMHSIAPHHPMWYRWPRMGNITWVHKIMEAYKKVMNDLMNGK